MNQYIDHLLATIDYRFRVATEYSGESLGTFDAGEGVRLPKEIVYHMFEVLLYADYRFLGAKKAEHRPEVLSMVEEEHRFLAKVEAIRHKIKGMELPFDHIKPMIQGPLADVLTHIGQLAMLSRLHGHPIKGQNYSRAEL